MKAKIGTSGLAFDINLAVLPDCVKTTIAATFRSLASSFAAFVIATNHFVEINQVFGKQSPSDHDLIQPS